MGEKNSTMLPDTRAQIGSKPKFVITAADIVNISRKLSRLTSFKIELSNRSHLSLYNKIQ